MAEDDAVRVVQGDRCGWCGGPVVQPRTGRRRRYCRRTCRDYAYVHRRTERLIDEAVDQALGVAPLPPLPPPTPALAAGVPDDPPRPGVSSIVESPRGDGE